MAQRDENKDKEKKKPLSVADRLRARRGEAAPKEAISEVEPIIPLEVELDREGPGEVLYQRSRSVLAKFFESVREGHPSDTSDIQALGASIVDNVLADQTMAPSELIRHKERSLFLRAFLAAGEDFDSVEHTLRVTILSAKLGAALGHTASEILKLSLAALLHNVGMLFVPQEIIDKDEPLSEDERLAIRQHSNLGAQFVRAMGGEFEAVAEIIFQVHERENGQGYPRGLIGPEILQEAKIIGICDVFVAMTMTRAYRKSMLPFDAMREIIQGMEGHFAPHIVRGLLQVLSIYPVGSIIRLNTGEIGRVISANPESPMRPVIELLLDPLGHRVDPPKIMNLTEHPLVYIKGATSRHMVRAIFGLKF
jgi:HD-GYP domain-containing protein (c-di-GMP phosphodiesterase class II)